jgi:hypothetical protein
MENFRKFIENTWLSLIISVAIILGWIFKNEKTEIDKKLSNIVDKEHLKSREESLLLKIDKNISEIKHGIDIRLTKIEKDLKGIKDKLS